MKVSLELLYHFECEACRKWWSVGDFDWPDKSAFVHCPHCGCRQRLPESPMLVEDFKADNTPRVQVPREAVNLHSPKDPILNAALALFSDYSTVESGLEVVYRIDSVSEQSMENAEEIYSDLQEQLRNLGFELTDPCIEHDCVSGILKRITAL